MKWLKKVGSTPLEAIAKVIDSLNTQTNDRTNAPSIRAVREAIENSSLEIYPIGSIYMSVNDVNPATIFGGTWQQIKDKFLLASGDTYENGATGGEATNSYTPNGSVGSHTLTIEEIPSHTHNFSLDDIWNDGTLWLAYSQTAEAGVQSTDISKPTAATGGGQPHNHGFTGTPATINNMPPYLAVNVWVRTA